MVNVEVVFDPRARYEIIHEGTRVGRDGAPFPSPPALFLASLGACAGAFAVAFLQARGLPFAGLKVTVEADHADNPRRLADIRLRVVLPGPIDGRHLQPLRRAVDLCTLKNTLAHPPLILAELSYPLAAA